MDKLCGWITQHEADDQAAEEQAEQVETRASEGGTAPAADVKRGIMEVGVDGVPLIIGIDGENVKRLQATSGTQIAAEPGTTLLLIRGTEEAIDRARTMIVAQLTAADLLETVECSVDAISAVIGKYLDTDFLISFRRCVALPLAAAVYFALYPAAASFLATATADIVGRWAL